MKKEELKLYQLWKKYINIPIYRIVPLRDLSKIRKQGINPKKDPFENIKPKIKQLFDLIYSLERKGKLIKLQWGNKKVLLSYATKTSSDDLSKPYVDFTPNKKDIDYYMIMKGGAFVTNVKRITKKLLESNFKFAKKDLQLIRYLNNWAKKRECDNGIIYVNGSSKSFENSKLQLLILSKSSKIKGKKKRVYLPSPFGSFEHFKKVVKKGGVSKYVQRLKNKNFYLRVKDKIPAKEIKF